MITPACDNKGSQRPLRAALALWRGRSNRRRHAVSFWISHDGGSCNQLISQRASPRYAVGVWPGRGCCCAESKRRSKEVATWHLRCWPGSRASSPPSIQSTGQCHCPRRRPFTAADGELDGARWCWHAVGGRVRYRASPCRAENQLRTKCRAATRPDARLLASVQ